MAADLKYFISSAKQIAKVSRSDKIIVEKSTLPVRTAEKVKEVLLKYGKKSVHFEILSNPEFLAEGTAINDLFKSDRVLIGGDSTKSGQAAVKSLVNIYKNGFPLQKNINYKCMVFRAFKTCIKCYASTKDLFDKFSISIM